MSYFKEIDSYETYANNEDDFHFIYNANSGGGQSFFGGKFRDANGNLASPASLNNRMGHFRFKVVYENEIHDISLADPSVCYEIKPRAVGNNSMKLSVGNKPNPSAVITSFLMLPETCGVKKSENINVSVLSKNNYWLQSMWLFVEIADENNVILTPRDCIIGGGVDENGQGSIKYFEINYQERISDIVKLADNDTLDSDIAICIKYFAEIYKGTKNFLYNEAVDVIKKLMKALSEKYPDRYSGTLDPITFIKEITSSNGGKMRSNFPYTLILFGAPGTGKTFIINNEAEKHFGTIIGITPKDIWQNISEEIQQSDKTAASLFAIGFKYSSTLKKENPKSLVQKFKITYDGAYAINQGIRVVDFYNKLPEYDAEKIDAIINEQLEKLKSEHFLMQAGSAAIGLKYSEYFYGKSTGDIISDLNLSKTSSQASWIWNGAQSANYFENSVEGKKTHRYERVTFHPNYSYAQFVGTYKPVQDKNDNTAIRYEYIPGPFMRVYVQAMKAKQAGLNDNFLLIIEEINRANVAAVFGDVFQLLDRKNGVSEYPVAASEDIKKYLKDNGIDDCEELRIPDNMYIWATMNSADQGVFPMDTAFKRRWEFEYIGIDENEDGIEKYEIPLETEKDAGGNTIGHKWIKWNKLRHSINDKLTEMKINEDKLLGPYFISEEKLKLVEGKKEENAAEFIKSFKSKVLMYLFEDAVKMRPGDLFNENAIGRLRFSDICKKFDEIGQGIFNFNK